MSRGWKCIGTVLVLTRNVSGPEMSQGRKCLRAGDVSGPEMSQGRRCLRAGLVSRFAAGDVQGRKCLLAGSVFWPEVSKILGLEVSRGRK
jgi:hypothetical protein